MPSTVCWIYQQSSIPAGRRSIHLPSPHQIDRDHSKNLPMFGSVKPVFWNQWKHSRNTYPISPRYRNLAQRTPDWTKLNMNTKGFRFGPYSHQYCRHPRFRKSIPRAFPLVYIRPVSHVLPVVIPAGNAVTSNAYLTLSHTVSILLFCLAATYIPQQPILQTQLREANRRDSRNISNARAFLPSYTRC